VTIARIILALVLAAAMAAAGGAKVSGQARMVQSAAHLGFTARAYAGIGALELAATVGLLAGFVWPVLGGLAALGCALLLGGAVIVHVRHQDAAKEVAPAAVLAVLAAAVAWLEFAAR
jgi:hypothetical protein